MQRESVERESCRSPAAGKPKDSRAGPIPPLHPLLQLQRTAGNRAVQRMLGKGVVQAKVKTASSHDVGRQEDVPPADPGHDDTAILNQPAAMLETTPATLQRSASTTDSTSPQESTPQEQDSPSGIASGLSLPRPPDGGVPSKSNGERGTRLDSSMRSFMGARFGHDFSGVRIHTDAPSARVADNFDAHAVTVGSNIYFERGGYTPETREGRSVLAHELTHVVQNERGAGGARASEASLEAEADRAGVRAAAGQPVRVQLGSQAPAALKLSRGAKTALGAGLGAALGGVAGAIGLGIAQAAGVTITGDLTNQVLLGAAGAGLVVGGLIGLFSKEKEQELPPEETETEEEKNQDFQTRFQRWLKKGLSKLHNSSCRFPSGDWRYDERYWDVVTDGEQFRTYKPRDIAPALAVDRLFQNLDRWDFDCAIYPEVAVIYAYRHTLGTNEFNTKFSDLKIRQHGTSGVPWELHTLESEGKAAFDKLWDESPVGTKITWTNRSSAADDTDWKNENGIKRIKGVTPDEDRFDAFPIGAHLSEKEVMRGLAENARDFPKSEGEAKKQAYVDSNIYRHQLQLLKNA